MRRFATSGLVFACFFQVVREEKFVRNLVLFALSMFVPLLAHASDVVVVPEPGALSLMLAGAAAIGAVKLRDYLKKK